MPHRDPASPRTGSASGYLRIVVAGSAQRRKAVGKTCQTPWNVLQFTETSQGVVMICPRHLSSLGSSSPCRQRGYYRLFPGPGASKAPMGMVWALGMVYGTIVPGSQSHHM